MGFQERVPNELWLEIFRSLPRDTLKALSLTSFKGISRPLLFTHLDFHPYTLYSGEVVLLPRKTEVNRSLERLDFWSSDEIARHVRSCNITPWQKIGPVWSTWDFTTTDTPYILLAALLERLARFTGLQKLHAQGVHFTPSGVATLCRAPALVSVQLVKCSTPSERPIAMEPLYLGVSRFSFIDGVTSQDGIDLWSSLLRPEHLCELELKCHPRFFGEDVAIPSFPRVNTLTITLNYSTMSYNLSILCKFPAVRTLSISGWGEVQDGPSTLLKPSAVLPILQQYTGSYETMTLFLPRSTLTHLVISYCTPRNFTAQLRAIEPNVTSLEVTFDDLDIPTLHTICAFFPALTELRIQIDSEVEDDGDEEQPTNDKAVTFFAELGAGAISAFPAGLQRLALNWKFEYPDDEFTTHSDDLSIPKFDKLRDLLVAHCLALKALWLDADNFLFHWRKLLDGDEYEYTATTDDDADQKRQEFNDFWEVR